MPIPILMPALSPTMTEGTLAKWHKQAGDSVTAGDVLAEIETDKATMEVEAVDEGVLARILVAEGTEDVAVNAPIAVLLEEGEDEAALAGFAVAAAPAPPTAPAQAAPLQAVPAQAVPAQAVSAQAAPAQAVPAPGGNGAAVGERQFVSPLARRMAAQFGIDLSQLGGSGPHGRIIKADIEAFRGGAPAAVPGVPAVSAPVPALVGSAQPIVGEAPFDLVPNSNIRKVIARRLTESKQTIPHYYLNIDCEIDRLLEIRKELNNRDDGFKLSVNDFVIRAVALALAQVPAANASWTDAGIRRYHRADVAVAVAIEGGLVTPVVRGAESKGLKLISVEMKALAEKARAGKLMPEDYQGGTFSISNLGMFGIRDFAAVINPPQGGILAIGAGEQRPVVKDGALAVATVMTCTLSGDHRVIDGAVGAEFMAAFKKLIQDPLTMLL